MSTNKRNQRYGSLDESEIILKQIELIQRTLAGDVTTLSDNEDVGMDVWATRVAAAVSGLEAALAPVITEDYKDEWNRQTNISDASQRIEYHTQRWEALMQIIAEHNIAFQDYDEFIVGEEIDEQ